MNIRVARQSIKNNGMSYILSCTTTIEGWFSSGFIWSTFRCPLEYLYKKIVICLMHTHRRVIIRTRLWANGNQKNSIPDRLTKWNVVVWYCVCMTSFCFVLFVSTKLLVFLLCNPKHPYTFSFNSLWPSLRVQGIRSVLVHLKRRGESFYITRSGFWLIV